MEVPARNGAGSGWPELRVRDWAGTRDTLHLWTQIVGKIRMAHAPMLNHWWQVTLYVTPRGLTTSSIPYGDGAFDLELDFCEHVLRLRTSNGTSANVNLSSKPVAEFLCRDLRCPGPARHRDGHSGGAERGRAGSPKTISMPLMTAMPSGCSGIS